MDLQPKTIGYRLLSLLGVKVEMARRLAPLGFALALLLACALAWGAWQAFDWFNDRDAVRDAANEANANFAEGKDKATGEADVASDNRRTEHNERVKRTEELIDEALEEGCVVADYLASGGTECVQPHAGVQGSTP